MSLRKMCRELSLEALIRRMLDSTASEGAEGLGRLQLIVDESSLSVVTSFLRISELTEAGIVSIDLINRQREPLPDLDALYILRPDPENLDRLLEDFRQASKPQHNQVHLAFTRVLAPDQLEQLASGSNLPPRVRSLVEVPLSFSMIQDRGFHFNMSHCIPLLFPKPVAGAGDELITDTGHRIADVCRCLQTTVPTIRHGQSHVCKLVADHVQQELAVYKRPNIGTSSKRETPCQLLILDRSVDMAAPLVHDYHYEAMAYDVLDGAATQVTTQCTIDIDRDVVKIADIMPKRPRTESEQQRSTVARKSIQELVHKETSATREALLSESDALWERLKHEHIATVNQDLPQRVTEICQSVDRRDAGDMEVGDMLNQLRKTPEHKDAIEKLEMHITIIQSINRKMDEQALSGDVGRLEQDIACGVSANQGSEIKPAELQTKLTQLVSGRELPGETKLRLLMLYLSCMANVPEQIRSKLIGYCNLAPEDNHVLMSLLQTKLMDVPESLQHLLGQGQVHRGVKTKQSQRYKKYAKEEGRFELSRFEPKVKELLEQLTSGKLSEEDYARLGDDAGDATPGGGLLRMTAAVVAADPPPCDDWSFAETALPGHAKSAAETPCEVTQRFIVFIIGGVTYSELRVASEVVKDLETRGVRGVEVLMGGTSLLTPRRLIQVMRPRQSEQAADADPEDLT